MQVVVPGHDREGRISGLGSDSPVEHLPILGVHAEEEEETRRVLRERGGEFEMRECVEELLCFYLDCLEKKRNYA